jgi:hypothetical protein
VLFGVGSFQHYCQGGTLVAVTFAGGETRKAVVSTDPFDVELEDPELLDEVGLTASLMVAANQSEGPLPQHEIDRLLGLR